LLHYAEKYRKNLGASTISSALNAHAGNMNGNSVSFQHFQICQVFIFFCEILLYFLYSMRKENSFFDSKKLFFVNEFDCCVV
jgi:hypothetical protein